MEDTHVADQNRNKDSKQNDGSDGNFKATPTDKEGMGSGGRSGSGMGGSGSGGSSGGGTSGTSRAGGSRGSGSTGYNAGSTEEDEEDLTAGDEGLDEGGGSSSGSSGSRNR